MSRIPTQLCMRGATLVAAFALASCGGGGGDSPASPTAATQSYTRPVEQSDTQIAQTVYSGSARTPTDFYADPAPTGYSFVSTTHLKNTDIDPALVPTAPQFELCSDDWNEALAWSEEGAMNAPQYASLVETNDDARYFEFGRVRPGTPQLYQRSRIFKCAYLDRATANLRGTGGAAGQLKRRPLTAVEMRLISEYLWQFTTYNNFGHAVLLSHGTSDTSSVSHTLYIASLVRAGMSATCDRIDVLAWRHAADASGALTLTVETLFSFGAREASGSVQLCAG